MIANYTTQFGLMLGGVQKGVNFWSVAAAGIVGAGGVLSASALGISGAAAEIRVGTVAGPVEVAVGVFSKPVPVSRWWWHEAHPCP